jgi:hypothetical protein
MRKFNVDEYEPVEERLARFYKDHEDGCILTELVSEPNARECAVFKASVYWGGALRATGYAQETRDTELAHTKDGREYETVNFTSWVENAETSAIGRALANAGYQGSKKPRASREEMEKVNRLLEGAGLVERKFYTCPKCGKEAVIKGAPQYGGGFVCWKKQGGCGAKFGENDPQITAQDLPTEPPPVEVDDSMKLELDLNDLLITAEGRLAKEDIGKLREGMVKHKGNIAWFAKALAATEAKLKEQEALLTANVEGATIQGTKQPEIF